MRPTDSELMNFIDVETNAHISMKYESGSYIYVIEWSHERGGDAWASGKTLREAITNAVKENNRLH